MQLDKWQEQVLEVPTAKRRLMEERNKTYHERMLSLGKQPVIIGSAYNSSHVKNFTKGGSVTYEPLGTIPRCLPVRYYSYDAVNPKKVVATKNHSNNRITSNGGVGCVFHRLISCNSKQHMYLHFPTQVSRMT